jgi:hypothetical protein
VGSHEADRAARCVDDSERLLRAAPELAIRCCLRGEVPIGTVVKWLTRWIHLQPLLAVILWGGIYPGAKLGLREIPVLSFTYVRILLAMIVLFAVSWRAQPLGFPRVVWKPLLQAGLAQTVFQFLLMAGLQRTTAGNSASSWPWPPC